MPEHGGDSRLVQPMHTVAGGSGLNTATHLSSLLRHFCTKDSADTRTSGVTLQTAINENDQYGKLILSHCKQHQFPLINRRVSTYPSCYFGTNEAASHRGEKSTGHCAVIVSRGDRSFMTHIGCSEDFRGSHILTHQTDKNGTPARQWVHIAGYFNIRGFWNGELACKLEEMRKTNQRLIISLVPQQDATDKWDGGLLDVLQYVDFLILNEVEAKSITKYQRGENDDTDEVKLFCHIAKFFCNSPQTCIIMTRGKKGAVGFIEREIIHQRTSPEINNPTDPTGAGDAFAAGYVYGYLSHLTENEDKGDDCMITKDAVKAAMQWACAVGTCSVNQQGASVPSNKESIERTLRTIHNTA